MWDSICHVSSDISWQLFGAAEGRAPPVLSIALEYMGMVLDFPCLALEANLIQKYVK